MTAGELIAALQKVAPETPVSTWDAYYDRETRQVYACPNDGRVLISYVDFWRKLTGL